MSEEAKCTLYYILWACSCLLFMSLLTGIIHLNSAWPEPEYIDPDTPAHVRFVLSPILFYRKHPLLYNTIMILAPLVAHLYYKKKNELTKYKKLLLISLAILWGTMVVGAVILFPAISAARLDTISRQS